MAHFLEWSSRKEKNTITGGASVIGSASVTQCSSSAAMADPRLDWDADDLSVADSEDGLDGRAGDCPNVVG